MAAVKSRTQDPGNNGPVAEAGTIEDVIWDATDIINMFCQSLYRPEDMVKSTW